VIGTFRGLYRLRDGVWNRSHPRMACRILSSSRFGRQPGAIWVGTKGGGINLIRGNRAIHIPPSAGVPAYPVFSVLDDGRGMLWLNTTRGLLRVSREQLQEVADGKRKTLDSFCWERMKDAQQRMCGMSQPPEHVQATACSGSRRRRVSFIQIRREAFRFRPCKPAWRFSGRPVGFERLSEGFPRAGIE